MEKMFLMVMILIGAFLIVAPDYVSADYDEPGTATATSPSGNTATAVGTGARALASEPQHMVQI